MTDWNLQPLIDGITDLEIRSCLIVQHGKPILEHYREPEIAKELGKINSCTKSVLAALVSIAIDKQIVPPPDTPISLFFPLLKEDQDQRKREITIRHLLTMTAGFNWTEFGGQNSFPTMTRTADWIKFVLAQPLSHTPGTEMNYNSGCSQILSAILRECSGQDVAAFAEDQLFQPLGIESYRWDSDPQGIHTGGFGLYMMPEDMLKFGLLYLQEGRWKDQQLIHSGTVQKSTRPYVAATLPQKGFYGWHWWVSSFNAGTEQQPKEIPYYFALGFMGQHIIVVPSYELVAVITADKYKKGSPANVFGRFIVPALLGQ
ncbi:serine hydrolase domain-containing protein [Paenibacillus sp. NPDC058367]|uniref:serine hydrolase domain-containing protein n=1 Tax=Paenibacillus sp. NPDC058367 TaxID=3346460 RepID=UPI00365E9545